MGTPFKDVSELPPKERAEHYRALANDALREAAKATEAATRNVYLLMAEKFQRLAMSLDANLDPDDTISS